MNIRSSYLAFMAVLLVGCAGGSVGTENPGFAADNTVQSSSAGESTVSAISSSSTLDTSVSTTQPDATGEEKLFVGLLGISDSVTISLWGKDQNSFMTPQSIWDTVVDAGTWVGLPASHFTALQGAWNLEAQARDGRSVLVSSFTDSLALNVTMAEWTVAVGGNPGWTSNPNANQLVILGSGIHEQTLLTSLDVVPPFHWGPGSYTLQLLTSTGAMLAQRTYLISP